MAADVEGYSQALIERILNASTQEEVQCLCDASVAWLEKRKMKAQYVHDFAAYSINALNRYTPINSGIEQWSSITAAKIFLYRIKRKYHFKS